MIAAGLSTALIWRALGLSGQIYEAFPGIMAGIIVFFIGSLLIPHMDSPNKRI
ncbi:MAG: xanthine/uracil permease [Candidatus Endobugula sp.]|jgi:hypothetical protein